MKSKLSLLPCLILICCSSAFAQEAEGASKLRISTPEEIRSEFDSVPCKNGDRLKAVKALFEKMGAKPEEIAVEKVRGVENILIRKARSEERRVGKECRYRRMRYSEIDKRRNI